ncbi:MAG: hypothetical protein JO249_24015 [Acidobacteria bacterium]|nr:hypothetical protein [Acidobacteriota bacterium]
MPDSFRDQFEPSLPWLRDGWPFQRDIFLANVVYENDSYKTFPSARRTLEGIETMHMIRKGRVRRVVKKDVVAEVKFVAQLFGLAA